jgi:hypothetical protein
MWMAIPGRKRHMVVLDFGWRRWCCRCLGRVNGDYEDEKGEDIYSYRRVLPESRAGL